MARPRKPVDENLLEKLAKLHLSDVVMAEILNISVDTLHRRYAEKIAAWRSKSKAKMAEVLFDEAIYQRKDYAVKMLAQKHLGYADKVEQKITETPYNVVLELIDE